MKVKDLEQEISKLLDIPVNEVLILLRHEPVTITAVPRIELFNMDWAREKLLKDMRS